MDRGLAVMLTAGVGCLVAMQAPINAGLAKAIGPRQSAVFSFLVGLLLLVIIAAFARGGLGRLADAGNVPAWYYLTGGLLGAAYVSTVLVTVKVIGAGPLTAATVAGQLSTSVADRPVRPARRREEPDHRAEGLRRAAARRGHVPDRA